MRMTQEILFKLYKGFGTFTSLFVLKTLPYAGANNFLLLGRSRFHTFY